ncbi:coat protein [uncultured Mediterranean phage uvMED]|nr:coat protein [uncultured Mediterranean phage uvMED]
MAVLRSDVIIPEVFTPYVIQQTTLRDSFLASGVVAPMAELNATEGGDFVNIPFFNANLTGDFEVLSDSSSLSPSKIGTGKQVGVILHRGKAFESRDLAAMAAGADPMAAIGQKIGAFIANQRQKDLLSCLGGVFGSVNTTTSSAALFELTIDGGSGDTPTVLSPRHVAKAKALLGDQGDKLTAVCVHSAVYYDLVERRLVDYVLASDGNGGSATASGGTIAPAYGGENTVPTYCGLRVIVSDDVQTVGSGATTEYATYFFTQGAVASGEQAGLTTETDRDILAKSDAMAIDLHYCYHPVGTKWAVTDSNPTRSVLETVGNWSKVYETKNIGIVRATNISTQD